MLVIRKIRINMKLVVVHWPLGYFNGTLKSNFQANFYNSWGISKWSSCGSYWIWLILSQHCFRQQAITWVIADPVLCRHVASLGNNELNDGYLQYVSYSLFNTMKCLLGVSWDKLPVSFEGDSNRDQELIMTSFHGRFWCLKYFTLGNPFAHPEKIITRPFCYLRGKCSFWLI